MITPSIAALPQELMDRILHFLPDHVDRLRLSTTCRALRATCAESVFENISMLWEGNAATVKHLVHSGTIRSPRIDLLLRTVMENPEVAASIKSVELHGIGFCKPMTFCFPPRLQVIPDQDLISQLSFYILSNKIPDPGLWEAAIRQGILDAFVALFLAHCPNLRSLTLGNDILREAHYLPLFLHWALLTFRSDVGFPYLKYVRLGKPSIQRRVLHHRTHGTHSLDLRSYLLFFYCPRIEHMDMDFLQLVGLEGFEDLQRTPNLACLKILQLRNASIQPLELGTILEWTSGIVRLEYDYTYDYNDDLNCEELNQALSHVKSTLQYCKIACCVLADDIVSPELTEFAYVSGRASFNDFSVLDTLHISPCVLFGWKRISAPMLHHTIPPSLQHLCFHDDFSSFWSNEWAATTLHKHLADHFEIENWNLNVPLLGSLDIINREDWFYGYECGAVEDLCRRNNVACKFVRELDKECIAK